MMLAAQMATIHMATTKLSRTLALDVSASQILTRLARTLATQMEALKRYRTGGQQRVVVEHVTVREELDSATQNSELFAQRRRPALLGQDHQLEGRSHLVRSLCLEQRTTTKR
jgi:hypothetical protein